MTNLTAKWYLDGTELGDFRGLSEQRIKNLRHIATVLGIPCFETPDCRPGTLELWQYRRRVAVIRGIGARGTSGKCAG